MGLKHTVTRRSAVLSPDRIYRYTLTRQWSATVFPDNPLVVIGLNPSTADEQQDDPTIRRCIRFSQDWGHDALVMLNLYAYRATDPQQLRVLDPATAVGPLNNATILAVTVAWRTLCAWGSYRGQQSADVVKMLTTTPTKRDLVCLGFTKDGSPKHPLYVKADTQPVPFPCTVAP